MKGLSCTILSAARLSKIFVRFSPTKHDFSWLLLLVYFWLGGVQPPGHCGNTVKAAFPSIPSYKMSRTPGIYWPSQWQRGTSLNPVAQKKIFTESLLHQLCSAFSPSKQKTGKPNKNSIQSWVVFCFPLPFFFLHLHSVRVNQEQRAFPASSVSDVLRLVSPPGMFNSTSCLLSLCWTPEQHAQLLHLERKTKLSLSLSFPLEIPSSFLLRKVLWAEPGLSR